MSSSVASATLSAVATKVEAPAVSAVHPVAVSSAPTATTYDEQHQIINDMKAGLIVSHIIRLSPIPTTAGPTIQRHCLLLSQPHGQSYSCPWSHDVDI